MLTYNIILTQLYNIKICCLCIFEMISSPVNIHHHIQLQNFFLVMNMLKIYSLSHFLSIHILILEPMLYITSFRT